MFEMLPNTFIRIQFRSVCGKALQVNLSRPTIGEEVFDLIRTVDTSTIPNDQQFATEIPEQMMYTEQQRDVFRDRLGHILKKHEITESLKSFEQDRETDFRPDAIGDLRGKGKIISRFVNFVAMGLV